MNECLAERSIQLEAFISSHRGRWTASTSATLDLSTVTVVDETGERVPPSGGQSDDDAALPNPNWQVVDQLVTQGHLQNHTTHQLTPSVCVSMRLSVHPSVCLSVCLLVCLKGL